MIRNLEKSQFYIVMGSIAVAAAIFFLTLTKPEKVIDDCLEEQDANQEKQNKEIARVMP